MEDCSAPVCDSRDGGTGGVMNDGEKSRWEQVGSVSYNRCV